MENLKQELLREIENFMQPHLAGIEAAIELRGKALERKGKAIEMRGIALEELENLTNSLFTRVETIESAMFKLADVLEKLKENSRRNEEKISMILNRLNTAD